MEADTLGLLEEKILRAVETVRKLKKEKELASAAASDTFALRSRVDELTREVEALRAEKEVVRKRVEKLLETIDSLASS